MKRALILGAGLQGACAALALAERGWSVVIIDQADRPLDRASRRNEGKIHLGLTYANDTSFATQSLMLQCGLEFGPLIERWCGPVDWPSITSTAFEYVIMRDSLVPADSLADAYARLAAAFDAGRRDSCYLGRRLEWLVDAPTPVVEGGGVSSRFASHTVRSCERALDLPAFCQIVLDRLLGHPRITFHARKRVMSVGRNGDGYVADGSCAAGAATWQERADVVVNCLWEGRRLIDASVGLQDERTQMLRLKYRILGRLDALPADASSYTLVLGRYGDVVINPSGQHYFSWYPACLVGTSTALAVPETWGPGIAGAAVDVDAQSVSTRALAALGQVLPMVRTARVDYVDAGVVCALGETDIDDLGSGLHRRSAIGVTSSDGYYSIDTGKLTCAPTFAVALTQAVDGR